MLPWMAGHLRGGLWFLLYVATQLGVEVARWTLGRNLGLGVLAGLAGVALSSASCCGWRPSSAALQGPGRPARPAAYRDRRHWRDGGLRLVSVLLLPRWLASWAIPFVAIGTSMALLVGVQLLATGWVVAAAFGAVYWGNASPAMTPSSGQDSTVESPSRPRRQARSPPEQAGHLHWFIRSGGCG
jgi:hypothetical protein